MHRLAFASSPENIFNNLEELRKYAQTGFQNQTYSEFGHWGQLEIAQATLELDLFIDQLKRILLPVVPAQNGKHDVKFE